MSTSVGSGSLNRGEPGSGPPSGSESPHDLRESTPARPSTPPLSAPSQPPKLRTPEPTPRDREQRLQAPRTPVAASAEGLHPASVYLSSPIRRTKHANWLTAGTMTPGRPSLKHNTGSNGPVSPFRASRPAGGGPVNLSTSQSMASLPLQTLLMTSTQAREISDLDTARETLVQALEQGEQFRAAAQQFRSLASHHAFQHKLVQIERDESEQRFEVEANIQKREIEKLVVDIMGYTDKSMDIDTIARRLRRTKHRLKEMEELVAAKDRQIADLQTMVGQFARIQSMPMGGMMPPHPFEQQQQQHHPPVVQPPSSSSSAAQVVSGPPSAHSDSHSSSYHSQTQTMQTLHTLQTQLQSQLHRAHTSPGTGPGPIAASHEDSGNLQDNKPRPPPIDTQLSAVSSPGSSNAEPLSALEVLASQVLSAGIRHEGAGGGGSGSGGSSTSDHTLDTKPSLGAPVPYGNSPYSSPFYAPFSPYGAIPPHARQPPLSVPQFGSPEKRRRPSSSSTISAMSEEDTLEDIGEDS